MADSKVRIFNNTDRKPIPRKKITESVKNVFKGEGISNYAISIIFVTDDFIHSLNKRFLRHNRPTDVITFNLSESNEIEGEIYISIQTAAKQAEEYNVSLKNEMLRLSCHGALHLAGYTDDTKAKREVMSSLENKYMLI